MTDEKYWGEKKPPTKKGAQPDGNKPEKHIAVHENKIYYYANVNRESAAELNYFIYKSKRFTRFCIPQQIVFQYFI